MAYSTWSACLVVEALTQGLAIEMALCGGPERLGAGSDTRVELSLPVCVDLTGFRCS